MSQNQFTAIITRICHVIPTYKQLTDTRKHKRKLSGMSKLINSKTRKRQINEKLGEINK
jgi:hypothetical protein